MANVNSNGPGANNTEPNKAKEEEARQQVDGEQKGTEAPKVETPPLRKPQPITITDIELEQLKKEASEYKDKYLRLLADSENARKRMHKERQELTQYAIQNVIVDFLNPIDHLENALKYTQQMSDEVKHWALGFQMILSQFKDVLSNNGVQPLVSIGTLFNPHMHEAVEMVATMDYPPGTVVEENIRGYKMGDRIIRPARVKVAKAPLPVSPGKEEQEEQENQKK